MQNKEYLKGSERFENGVLRADACCERFAAASRMDELNTEEENACERSFGAKAYFDERRTMAKIYELKAKGILWDGRVSAEIFVQRHKNHLSEEV